MEKVIRRRRWMVHRKLNGWSTAEIASHLSVSDRTVLRWWEAYRKYGWNGLLIKPMRPYTIHQTPSNVINQIIGIRQQHGWGPNKIEAWLKRNGSPVSHTTIHKIAAMASTTQ